MDKDTIHATINELIKIIDAEKFLDIVNDPGVDRYVKKLTAYRFFLIGIVAQLKGTESLRSLSEYQKHSGPFQSLVDFKSISTSQLSRKQSTLPSDIFETVFKYLMTAVQAQMKHTPQFGEVGKLRAIDSTTMSMSFSQYPWAQFRQTKAGVRLHLSVRVTQDLTVPDQAILTDAKQADRSQMEALVDFDSDAIQLFDRGYNDYKQFDALCANDARFVTKLKKNATVEVLDVKTPDLDSHIFADQTVMLGHAQNGTKMAHPLRLIITHDSEGNAVRLISNCFGLSAKEIGDLYRNRWKIETFFKWMKQHLKMKHFYGKSQNAVYTQIWIALITYCLQVLLKLKLNHKGPLLDFKRALQHLMFEPFDAFVRALFRPPERSSKGRQKQRWADDFQHIIAQYAVGAADHLDDVTYDPLFL